MLSSLSRRPWIDLTPIRRAAATHAGVIDRIMGIERKTERDTLHQPF